MQAVRKPCSLDLLNAGSNNAASTAITAITTKGSIKLKAD